MKRVKEMWATWVRNVRNLKSQSRSSAVIRPLQARKMQKTHGLLKGQGYILGNPLNPLQPCESKLKPIEEDRVLNYYNLANNRPLESIGEDHNDHDVLSEEATPKEEITVVDVEKTVENFKTPAAIVEETPAEEESPETPGAEKRSVIFKQLIPALKKQVLLGHEQLLEKAGEKAGFRGGEESGTMSGTMSSTMSRTVTIFGRSKT
jgi:hypothetical protein